MVETPTGGGPFELSPVASAMASEPQLSLFRSDFERITSSAMAQGDAPTESHDVEKANVVVDESASHEHIAHEESSSSASVDGEKQAQSSAESVDTSEARQSYLVSSRSKTLASSYVLLIFSYRLIGMGPTIRPTLTTGRPCSDGLLPF